MINFFSAPNFQSLEPSERHRFFSPVEQAQNKIIQSSPKLSVMFLKYLSRLALAFSAAALEIMPSEQYAKAQNQNPIPYQLSCFLTALLINLYGINRLADELRLTQKQEKLVFLAIVLGALSTLPIFFIQQVENKHETLFSLIESIVITAGSAPLQILGFLEFFQNIYPEILRLYLNFYNSPENLNRLKEWGTGDDFLRELKVGIDRCIMDNHIPDDFLECDPKVLLEEFITKGKSRLYSAENESKALIPKKIIFGIVGVLGLILAEVGNIAYIKATDQELIKTCPFILAELLSAGVSFPSCILLAEFGFHAATSACQMGLELGLQLKATCFQDEKQHSFSPLVEIAPKASAMLGAFVLCIISLSYASSVQFNNDLFENKLSETKLELFNYSTIFGVLLFNHYVLSSVFFGFLPEMLTNSSDPQVTNKSRFYQFGQDIFWHYHRMPKNELFEGINETLSDHQSAP